MTPIPARTTGPGYRGPDRRARTPRLDPELFSATRLRLLWLTVAAGGLVLVLPPTGLDAAALALPTAVLWLAGGVLGLLAGVLLLVSGRLTGRAPTAMLGVAFLTLAAPRTVPHLSALLGDPPAELPPAGDPVFATVLAAAAAVVALHLPPVDTRRRPLWAALGWPTLATVLSATLVTYSARSAAVPLDAAVDRWRGGVTLLSWAVVLGWSTLRRGGGLDPVERRVVHGSLLLWVTAGALQASAAPEAVALGQAVSLTGTGLLLAAAAVQLRGATSAGQAEVRRVRGRLATVEQRRRAAARSLHELRGSLAAVRNATRTLAVPTTLDGTTQRSLQAAVHHELDRLLELTASLEQHERDTPTPPASPPGGPPGRPR